MCTLSFSLPVDVTDRAEMMKIVGSSLGTKFMRKWSDLACNIAIDATATVSIEENGRREIDIKRYAKIEKVLPGLATFNRMSNSFSSIMSITGVNIKCWVFYLLLFYTRFLVDQLKILKF